ncbi:uncharacterized protein BXZ73DRAFT_38181 [Epithele typhae]|uniref:uncharacterized protein n=1 Tax=Epithele typhae TaxID=378194 RepID=UPI0020080529|nr:uncharacterized protein BXZ73DRAFT_38181 [Epithele typhae]KAH9945111.1 hypothetical protein BXZ73DRAFT_38181 [Epithele typhae]
MATPSSSATTPSPRPRYLQSAGSASSSAIAPNGMPSVEGVDRDHLAQKITAGAHLGELALNLRARLLYANFKVKSSSTGNSFHELDNQHAAPGKHTPSTKRTANFFGEPGSPGGGGAHAPRSAKKGSMAPPPSVTASATQSLFSSLLAPPPAKRARTIHNPEDPPAAAPEKPAEPHRTPHRSSKATRTPDTHSKSKSRKTKEKEKEKAGRTPAGKGKGKGKQRVTAEGSFEERDIDIEAATTLTTILLNQQRTSASTTAGSPRSSISAGSDPGSVHSFAQYAQSAARTAPGGKPARTASQHSLFGRATRSTATPPHSPGMSQASPALSHAKARRPSVSHGSGLRPEGAGTPKMTPRDRVDDTDAADMLLLMATSPSPARPSASRDSDARDAAAFRALRGGGSGLKGRVLFLTGDEGIGSPRMLQRDYSGSFASVSSIATEPASPRAQPALVARRDSNAPNAPSRLSSVHDAPRALATGHLEVPLLPTVTPPTPTDPAPSQLSPPALSASQRPHQHLQSPSRGPRYTLPPSVPDPHTPNPAFSLSEYMHVSPSPATAMTGLSLLPSHAGRRLFEDHHGHPLTMPPPEVPSSPSRIAGPRTSQS